MPELFEKRKVFIAQPPLYEVRLKGNKKSEYVLSENEMRKQMTTWGLHGTTLVVRQVKEGNILDETALELSGDELASLVKILGDVERTMGVLSRRGIHFNEFVQKYYNGAALPEYLIRMAGEDEVFYTAEDYERRLDELGGDKTDLNEDEEREAHYLAEELHEVARINQINETIKQNHALDLRDFLLKQERSVSGEALRTKFQLKNGDDAFDIASLGDICPGIRQVGGRGVEIKRFKGLGEMNADQLWDTTMNPATRTLLSVKIEDAGEADRLFSILMGDDVEQRRTFIKEHALEVQNLDV
jgi:DNA gyrase subunit B